MTERRRRGGGSSAASRAASIVALVMIAAGCSEHSVGPARTYDDFERKSRTSAEVALSTVETVRLIAETSSAGRAFGSYTSVSISEQEDTLNGVQGDFGSIQPPDQRADDLRDELDGLLGTALDHLSAVRIAARRGQLGDLDKVAAPLADDSRALQDFLDSIARS